MKTGLLISNKEAVTIFTLVTTAHHRTHWQPIHRAVVCDVQKMKQQLLIVLIVIIAVIILLWKPIKEEFAPVSAVSQYPYPRQAVIDAEKTVNLVTDAYASTYQGTQIPIGLPPLSSAYERSAIPLSNTIVSPYCCPSEYSSSGGCYCYGYPARWKQW